MGYKHLSKQYRAVRECIDSLLVKSNNEDNPDVPIITPNPRIANKRIGVDLSVILHVALGNIISAGEFQQIPKIPISKVNEACEKLIAFARRTNITLIICADGLYHRYKGSVNKSRSSSRCSAQQKLDEIFKAGGDIAGRMNEINPLLKKAVFVSEEVLQQAKEIFERNKVEVHCASHEADFQLLYWERTGYTHGTMSVDSDIFVLGSKLFIDNLKVGTKLGECKILCREEVMKANAFMDGSSEWTDEDLQVYGTLQGCDWIPRLYGLKQTSIKSFMTKWRNTRSQHGRMQLLEDLCKNKHWPAEGDKTGKGEKATDFPRRFIQCLEFAKYAPVFGRDKNNQLSIVPWNDIPDTETREWQEIIGFDPMKGFSNLNLDDCYDLRIWPRTGKELRRFERPMDEIDTTRQLPHNSVIKFRVPGAEDDGSPKVPVEVVPVSSLLVWLCFHGVPMPKGSTKAALIEKVTLAVLKKQKLDYERISLNDAIGRQSYISWEQMVNVSDLQWNKTPEFGLNFLREMAKPVDSSYINEKFGAGKNGVRERAWKRFNSGSLDTNSLRVGTAKMEGEDDRVIIIEIKCTPSVKSDVYGVCLVFRSDGTYLPNKSKCDCPNGWLFCSHSLALFLLVRLIQVKPHWTFDDICTFMPQPIKSLQNLPIAAGMVFKQGCPRKAYSKLGKKLAKELPGYSQKDVASKKDADEAEEVEAQKEALKQAKDDDVKSIDICLMMDEFVKQSSDADEIDNRTNEEDAEANQSVSNGKGKKKGKKKRRKKKKNQNLTSDAIHEYNATLVHGAVDDQTKIKDLLRHNRIEELISNKMLCSDMALTPHLAHFREDRQRQLQEKSQARASVNLPDNCNIRHLEEFRKRCNPSTVQKPAAPGG